MPQLFGCRVTVRNLLDRGTSVGRITMYKGDFSRPCHCGVEREWGGKGDTTYRLCRSSRPLPRGDLKTTKGVVLKGAASATSIIGRISLWNQAAKGIVTLICAQCDSDNRVLRCAPPTRSESLADVRNSRELCVKCRRLRHGHHALKEPGP